MIKRLVVQEMIRQMFHTMNGPKRLDPIVVKVTNLADLTIQPVLELPYFKRLMRL